jgi:hypothetical protein
VPYQRGQRLPGERASKLGHLQVVKSDLVNRLIDRFSTPVSSSELPKPTWLPVPQPTEPLKVVFAVDGSFQIVQSERMPRRELGFVKTAMLRLDWGAIRKMDPSAPHPFGLRDLLKETALYHATVFPLKLISIEGMNNYDAIRNIVYDSLRDPALNGEPYETLKWLAYEKWRPGQHRSPEFACPNCDKNIPGLAPDTDEGKCPMCGGKVLLSDVIGFHLEMTEDATPSSVATSYMTVHENLLLFTAIRHFWEKRGHGILGECLFLKDGPLTLRAQYSKLVIPIRRFLQDARDQGVSIHIAGHEKSGLFFDHLQAIANDAPPGHYFVPSEKYIRREIQRQPDRGEAYGLRTNYGAKVFLKTDDSHHVVLNIPTGEFKEAQGIDDLIGAARILRSVKELKSYQHEGALLPIHLANGIASLSTYPSAQVLKLFASELIGDA